MREKGKRTSGQAKQAGQMKALGALEERLMNELWALSPRSVREVCDRLDGELAYTTVMTTLDRLFKKGLLAREKEGNAFRYRPALTRDEYHRRLVETAVSPLLAESGEPVLAAFVDLAASIDDENLSRLEALVAEHRKAKQERGR